MGLNILTPVHITGETSAGKSSVLNLLFEDDVLPVHTKSSTSVITIVRYDRKAHAKIVYKTNEPERVFDLDDEGVKELHAVAFMENADERESHNIKEVQVYLPLALLKVNQSNIIDIYNSQSILISFIKHYLSLLN